VEYIATFKNKLKGEDASQQTISVRQGDTLELTFSCDEPVELHLHGYDRLVTVAPGVQAKLALRADIAGRFSIEAHKLGGASKTGHGRALRDSGPERQRAAG